MDVEQAGLTECNKDGDEELLNGDDGTSRKKRCTTWVNESDPAKSDRKPASASKRAALVSTHSVQFRVKRHLELRLETSEIERSDAQKGREKRKMRAKAMRSRLFRAK